MIRARPEEHLHVAVAGPNGAAILVSPIESGLLVSDFTRFGGMEGIVS